MNSLFTIIMFSAFVSFFIYSMNQLPSSNMRQLKEQKLQSNFNREKNTKQILPTYTNDNSFIANNNVRKTHKGLVYKSVSKNGNISYSDVNINPNKTETNNKLVKILKLEPSRIKSQSSEERVKYWTSASKLPKKAQNHAYIQNNYNQSNDNKTSLSTCKYYKKQFEWFSEKMRRGYTAQEYEWLESNRVKYRDLLFNNCDSHKLI